ncbi:MAG TPA: hypothetical protein PKN80_08410, partial [bacterium]|nr:hypothetical protein [bacterium]
MIPRPDLLVPGAPPGTEIYQLTSEAIPSSHVYMEAQIFTPDSRRFLLHRSAHAHGGGLLPHDPEHQYLLCDLEAGGARSPLITEPDAIAPSVSPDGGLVYYLVDRSEADKPSLILKRIELASGDCRTLAVIDTAIAGTRYLPGRVYPLSTIRSDGRRLAAALALRDPEEPAWRWGLLVFDLENGGHRLVLEGPSWCNLHPQYCRSRQPEWSRTVLVQENHGNVHDAAGRLLQLTGGAGADIHLVNDDGSGFRDFPCGRDGREFCQGHQCWRGSGETAILGTVIQSPPGEGEGRLVECRPVTAAGHRGLRSPGGWRNELSRGFPTPHFHHFGTDATGRFILTDYLPGTGNFVAWAR